MLIKQNITFPQNNIDVCDELKGVYPKEFKFTGWHPFCRCYTTTVLPSREEFYKYAELDEEEAANYHFKGEVRDMPKQFTDWLDNNQERIAKAKSMPYFLRDNVKFINLDGNVFADKLNNAAVVGELKLSKKQKELIKGGVRDIEKRTKIFAGQDFTVNLENTSDGTLMSWKDGKLTLSTCIYNVGKTTFCPAREFMTACQKLQKGKSLNFLEEYAIEALYHESVHATTMRSLGLPSKGAARNIMETCTQLWARDNYPHILNAYGVEAICFDATKLGGLGYRRECLKLREYFEDDNGRIIADAKLIAQEELNGVQWLRNRLAQKGKSRQEIEDFVNLWV